MLADGTENCDYLLACDLDYTPLPGFRWTSYDQGYGDMRGVVDPTTIRYLPWLEKTALVLVDLVDVDSGVPVEVSPRRMLQRQVDAATDAGYVAMFGSEIEFFLFKESYDDAHADGYRTLTPNSPYLEDYNILQTTKEEDVLGAMRRGLAGAGLPVEFSKGEAGRGQHEINLTYQRAVEMADIDVIFKTAVKEIAASRGKSATFMAKPHFDDAGSSCHIHSSLWDADGATSLMAGRRRAPHERRVPLVPRRTDGDRRRVRPAGGADGEQLPPLPAGELGADRHRVGGRQPHARVPGGRPRSGDARREPHPGRRRQHRTTPSPPPSPAGCTASPTASSRRAPYDGDGYAATDLARIPSSFAEAIERWRASTIARECFGDDVHHHVLHFAETELAAFGATVTDWERRRYFERI